MTKLQRFLLLYAIFNLCLLFCACGDWTSQASSIIGLLIPAVQSAVAILLAFGVGVSPTAMAAVQAWGKTAQDALTNVIGPAIAAYKTAAADAKATLLSEIKAALDSIIGNLNQVLADVHVTNPQTQAKISAIFGLISGWLLALMNLIPAIQGKVGHAEAKRLVAAVKTSDEFKEEFNQVAESFGKQYAI